VKKEVGVKSKLRNREKNDPCKYIEHGGGQAQGGVGGNPFRFNANIFGDRRGRGKPPFSKSRTYDSAQEENEKLVSETRETRERSRRGGGSCQNIA